MRNRIINKMVKLNKSYYFTEKPVYRDGDYDSKYFICMIETHNTVKASKTLRELEEWLNDKLEEQDIEERMYKILQEEQEEILKAYETECQNEREARKEAVRIWEEEQRAKTERLAKEWEEEFEKEQARLRDL